MRWLKSFLIRWLLSDFDLRLKDVERHFVTKRDESGKVLETLADVPLSARKEREIHLRGANWQQRRRYLEATDGGRRLAN